MEHVSDIQDETVKTAQLRCSAYSANIQAVIVEKLCTYFDVIHKDNISLDYSNMTKNVSEKTCHFCL